MFGFIFGLVGFDAIAQGGPLAAEPLSGQAAPAPLAMEWANDTALAVTSEPGVAAED